MNENNVINESLQTEAALKSESITRTAGKTAVKEKEQFFTTRSITMMAVFTALACILYIVPIFQFKLPILFPSFLEFQFSDLPVLLCGFMFGPWHGVVVLVLKILIKLPFSSTIYVGELGDLIIGLAFLIPSALIYRYKHNLKGAIIGLITGLICTVLAAVIVNRYILIPLYVQFLPFLKGDIQNLVNAVKGLYPAITVESFYTYYLSLAVVPFNLIRGFVSALITLLVYKSLSKAIKSLFKERKFIPAG